MRASQVSSNQPIVKERCSTTIGRLLQGTALVPEVLLHESLRLGKALGLCQRQNPEQAKLSVSGKRSSEGILQTKTSPQRSEADANDETLTAGGQVPSMPLWLHNGTIRWISIASADRPCGRCYDFSWRSIVQYSHSAREDHTSQHILDIAPLNRLGVPSCLPKTSSSSLPQKIPMLPEAACQ